MALCDGFVCRKPPPVSALRTAKFAHVQILHFEREGFGARAHPLLHWG